MFKCPYCNISTFTKASQQKHKKLYFDSWKSVAAHIAHCKFNNHEYYTHPILGPIHYLDITNELVNTNNLIIHTILGTFEKHKLKCINYHPAEILTKEKIINSMKQFYIINNKIPSILDCNSELLPFSDSSVRRHCVSWKNALFLAGLPDIIYPTNFSKPTKAKDNILYRSRLEAYFVDTCLYNKYKYIYEVPYNDGTRKKYAFYLPDLDLYIEVAGGLNPSIIESKIKINKDLNRKLLVLRPSDILTNKALKALVAMQ